ncbi:MAG: type II toxin-antitoxin system mRNA interferase toxin, RelE/StbE family [Patescibacteria group bacterium]
MNVIKIRIDYSRKFNKQLKKAPLSIKIAFRDRLIIFLKNPFAPILNNHHLKGKYLYSRSVNITGDWRAIYSEVIENKIKVVIFLALGTHSQLYK